jgi:hypothetical protein
MSDGAVGRWLTSRKNLAGMTGALVGAGLAFADVSAWPLAAVALYGVGALLAPSDPPPAQPQLTDALRSYAADLAGRLDRAAATLPAGAPAAVTRILGVLALVLDRLDEVADQPVDRAAAPERLATVAEIIRVDLPSCLDTFLVRGPSTSSARAAAELVRQLDVIAGAVDRLAAGVPDVHAQRAEELTRDLLRRHGEPG